ncbi:response regulator [Sulfurovum sp. zt1-1]|uniref:Response regulator n=1 Tax=Sulfurovum zhangzhouensis TaxID=3019067 RepID=A0ABT7QY80_9BACT|nr:response regulator [Sulfurovum zhangzhouensis]MDM5271726.1 response regulator [Sulfurovum zhangzhouensis]
MHPSNTSSLLDLVIVVSILLLFLAIYLYVSSKNKRNYTQTETPLSTSAQMKTYVDKTNITPSAYNEISVKYPLSTLPTTEKTLPYTTNKPFEETPNITVDDFYNFKGARLLLVEDNKINQKIFQSVLQKSGILITIANNGQEALNYLYTPDREFDLVLMDISMPEMDGYTCTEKIRANHHFDKLPIITLTAFAMGKEIERMYALGANGYITKPLHIGQLYTVFTTYLGHIQRPVSTLSALKMKGLDIEAGIAMYEGDEELYKQMLREFIVLYGSLIKQMPKWIEEKDYDKVKLNIVKIGSKLHSLGAYELEEAVARMKKFFIYGTEHRIEEFKDVFPEKLNRLIIAMRLYLQGEIL